MLILGHYNTVTQIRDFLLARPKPRWQVTALGKIQKEVTSESVALQRDTIHHNLNLISVRVSRLNEAQITISIHLVRTIKTVRTGVVRILTRPISHHPMGNTVGNITIITEQVTRIGTVVVQGKGPRIVRLLVTIVSLILIHQCMVERNMQGQIPTGNILLEVDRLTHNLIIKIQGRTVVQEHQQVTMEDLVTLQIHILMDTVKIACLLDHKVLLEAWDHLMDHHITAQVGQAAISLKMEDQADIRIILTQLPECLLDLSTVVPVFLTELLAMIAQEHKVDTQLRIMVRTEDKTQITL